MAIIQLVMDLQLSKFVITQYIKKWVNKIFDKHPLNSTALLSKMENRESSYYSVSYGPTALKLCHDTENTSVQWLAFCQRQSRILGQHWVLKSVNSVLSPVFANRFQICVARWVFVVT